MYVKPESIEKLSANLDCVKMNLGKVVTNILKKLKKKKHVIEMSLLVIILKMI